MVEMLQKGRCSNWSCTPDALASAIGVETFMQLLIPNVYKSTHMKKGICAAGLLQWQALLISLITLDPRGGFFSQLDMENAIEKVYDDSTPETKEKAQQMAADDVRTLKAFLARLAYIIRVMLVHTRSKYKKSDKDTEFAQLFACIAAPVAHAQTRGSSSAKADKKVHANPFLNFRDEEEQMGEDASEHDDTDDEEVVAATYYDPILVPVLPTYRERQFAQGSLV